MKFFLRDYATECNLENSTLYACSIIMSDGEELFSYIREIEPDVYYLQDPLKIIRTLDEKDQPMILFKKFNYFSDDFNMIVRGRSITAINYLSESFIESYKRAVENIRNRTLKIETEGVVQQILNEGDDFDSIEVPEGVVFN